MEVVARVVAFLAGAGLALGIAASALRTVVVPRAEPSFLTASVFITVRRWYGFRVKHADSWEEADARMARYPAVALMVLPGVWIAGMIAAFTSMFWALGSKFPREAFTRAGSSLLTLGFAFAKDLPETVLSFVAATLGLGIVALLISYLPSIYSQFSRREAAVGQLDVRAGSPPSAAELLVRATRIEWLEELDDVWREWDRWFVEVEESHVSNSALPFFRSQHPTRSWITAAGCVLDAASLRASIFDLPRSFEAELCVRSGFVSLRHIADTFQLAYDPDPRPGDPIAVTREEFDDVWNQLAAEGAPLRTNREQAWLDFAGWRVNYDAVLIQLCALVVAPPALWSADRSLASVRMRLGKNR